MPKKNAQPSVRRSPEFSDRSAPVSRKSPTVATATAASTFGAGALRNTTVSTSGVKTTNKPVMNAEFDVVVRSKPAFWNQYPTNATTPNASIAGANIRRVASLPGRRQSRASANGASTSAPTANRKRMKPTGVTCSSASCTSTNVLP